MKTFFPGVQVLRGLAAMMVVIYHLTHHWDYHGSLLPDGNWLKEIGSFGPTGVFVFFVISGFVIPLSMIENNYRIGDFLRFFTRRLIRLEPPYIATILMILAVSFYFSYTNHTPWDFSWKRFGAHFLYLVPWTGQEWYNPIFWTLAIEFQFYIFLGIALPILLWASGWGRVVAISALVILGYFTPYNSLLPVYLPVFSLGITLVFFKKQLLDKYQASVCFVVASVFTFVIHPLDFSIASVCAVLFIAFVTTEWRPLLWLGEISYSLYLTHGLIGGNFLYLFQFRSEALSWKVLLLLLATIGSIVFARIFYQIIEGPARRWSGRVGK